MPEKQSKLEYVSNGLRYKVRLRGKLVDAYKVASSIFISEGEPGIVLLLEDCIQIIDGKIAKLKEASCTDTIEEKG